MSSSRPFAYNTCSIDGSCDTISVTYTLEGEPVTVEVDKTGTFNGKNIYNITTAEYQLIIKWESGDIPPYWLVIYTDLATETEYFLTLSEDTPCPFGVFTIEEGSPFEAFSVGCVPVPIPGTDQVGDIAIGWPTDGFESTGLEWWNGPDEELGYVICKPVPSDIQPTQFFAGNLQCSTTYKGVNINLSNSNQTAYQQFGYQMSVLCDTILDNRAKVMFSVSVSLANPPALPGSHFVGIGTRSMFYQGNPYGAFPGNDVYSMGYGSDGNIWYSGSVYSSGYSLLPFGDGDIIDICINNNTQGMWVRLNGGDWNNDPGQDPVTNPSLAIEIINSPFYPVLCPGYEGTMTIQNTATYGVPDGYTLLGGNEGASIAFNRSVDLTEGSFVSLVNSTFSQSFSTGADAKTWLNTNGYWTSYNDSSVLSLDAADYSGSGPWIDSVGGKSFTLTNSPTWSSSNGGYFDFIPSSSQYAICSTSLPVLSNWSIGVWHYYAGTNVGSLPCIVSETFTGGALNYTLGNSTGGGLSSGFFNGGWQISGAYSLTPGNWYYIVGTYDGITNNLYVNNTLVASNNYSWTISSQGSGIRLMERWDSADYWGGRLAKVNIYDKALDTNEISSIWNSNKLRFGL